LTVIARRIRVTGIVQGVGFRPFVWRLAQELTLTGWVRNDPYGVEIAAQATWSRLPCCCAHQGGGADVGTHRHRARA
jgi:hydrogenase maturation protein HypF